MQEDFGGLATAPLNGTSAVFDAGVLAAGGSATWVANLDYAANGAVTGTVTGQAGNTSSHLSLGSFIDDAEGTADGLFTLEVTVSNVTGTFATIGFAASNSPSTTTNFLGGVPFGTAGSSAHLILRANGENDAFVDSPGSGTPATNNSLVLDGNVANGVEHTLTITLDVRDHNGTDNFGSVLFESSATTGGLGTFDFESDQTFGSILLSDGTNTQATFSDLVLTQFVEVEVGLPGDSNNDGFVDSADYTVLRDLFGQSVTLPGENPAAVTPGVVDLEDFDFFVSQFGASSSAVSTVVAATAVPEPGALLLLFAGVASALNLRNRR